MSNPQNVISAAEQVLEEFGKLPQPLTVFPAKLAIAIIVLGSVIEELEPPIIIEGMEEEDGD